MKQVKIGIIGLGWIGSEHARNILANSKAELAAISEPKAEVVSAFREKHNIDTEYFKDYKKLLKSNIDAVIIASPNNMHAEMSIEAAGNGKHIYAEKPMAITVDDCKRIREAVEKAGVKYLIGYHRRFNPLYQYAKNLLNEGKLGKPFMVESDYMHHVPGHWDIWTWLGKESIAGSILHAGSGHNVDLIRYFCGDIKEVACFKDIFLPRKNQVETEDTVASIFRFKNGAIGKVQSCMGPILPFTFSFKFLGTKGSVINNKIHLDTIPKFEESGHEKEYIELPEKWIPDNVQGGISEPWNKSMDHFIDMLTENAECINDIESAYKTSITCFAAIKSAKTKQIINVGGLL